MPTSTSEDRVLLAAILAIGLSKGKTAEQIELESKFFFCVANNLALLSLGLGLEGEEPEEESPDAETEARHPGRGARR